jgi:hypothetical protein
MRLPDPPKVIKVDKTDRVSLETRLHIINLSHELFLRDLDLVDLSWRESGA